MESLPSKTLHLLAGLRAQTAGFGLEAGPVGGVTQDRVADMGKVDPDLMGAAGFQRALQQAGNGLAVGARKALQDFPMGDGLASAGADRLLVAGMRMAAERRIDRSLRAIRRAPDKCKIAAPERPFGLLRELLAQRPVRPVGLGDDH